MTIRKLVCGVRTACLFAIALVGLTAASGQNAFALSPGCTFLQKFGGGTGNGFFSIHFGYTEKFHLSFNAGEAVSLSLSDVGPNLLGTFYSFDMSPAVNGFYSDIYFFSNNAINVTWPILTNSALLSIEVTTFDPNTVVTVLGNCASRNPPSAVNTIAPTSGAASGGTAVGITGAGFTGATGVAFGGSSAASFTVNNDNSITATAPAGSGIVDVTVATAAGASVLSVADQFTYIGTLTPAPTVTSVTPDFGALSGAEVTITGTNFLTGITKVNFGSVGSNYFVVNSATSITVQAPDGTGSVDLTVTNAGGTSPTSVADRFTYTAANTHDFNGDGKSDLFWRDTAGDLAVWVMNGSGIASSANLGNVSPSIWSIIGLRDFSGTGNADVLWRNASGDVSIWFMNGASVSSTASLGNVPINWAVYGTGDLDGNGTGDLLWEDTSGEVAVWFMRGSSTISTASLGSVPSNWSIAGDDSNGNIYWRDTAGDLAIWQVRGSAIAASASLGNIPPNWRIAGFGDFNGDGVTDILWRDSTSNTVAIWFMTSAMTISSSTSLGVAPSTWSIVQTGDYNGDGYSDIFWIDNTGNTAVWFMNGGTISSSAGYGNVGTTWSVQSMSAE